MLHRNIVVGLLAAGLLVGGCSSGAPPAPTPAVTTAATTTPTVESTSTPAATPEATPQAGDTGTPDLSATATPGEEETLDPAYVKVKEEGVNLALGKGYEEAIPILQKALEVKPDDPEVHFYLMLSQGNLEEAPAPKSLAYAHAKKVLELAPGSSMAERARDYVLSAESEPAKPLPDLNVPEIPHRGGKWDYKSNAVYTLPVPAYMLEGQRMGEALMKELWYLEVVPHSVTDKVQLPKGTQFVITDTRDFLFSKTSWRGGRLQVADADTNMYHLAAFEIQIEKGPKKGAKGWFVNQMDRFSGVTGEKEEQVWGTKLGPRLPIDHE